MTDDLEIRRATASDREAVLALASRSLGWAGDERDRAFFTWKHEENPFGISPAWVATIGGEVVGFRTLLRWELTDGTRTLRVVRAVDTATDPAFQGRGIFRALTLGAVEALTAEGVDAVFNTPNDQSLPGYLSMGWSVVGRPTLSVIPRSIRSLARLARTRAAAGKWGEPVDVGAPAGASLQEADLDSLLRGLPHRSGWATRRLAAHLRWRYAFPPLGYRAVEVKGGLCVFRVRNRGSSREVAICEWLSAERDPRAVRRLVRAGGDYGVGIGLHLPGHGALPLPRQGPVVTWRPLADPAVPRLRDLRLGLGDLELL